MVKDINHKDKFKMTLKLFTYELFTKKPPRRDLGFLYRQKSTVEKKIAELKLDLEYRTNEKSKADNLLAKLRAEKKDTSATRIANLLPTVWECVEICKKNLNRAETKLSKLTSEISAKRQPQLK